MTEESKLFKYLDCVADQTTIALDGVFVVVGTVVAVVTFTILLPFWLIGKFSHVSKDDDTQLL